MADWQPRMRLGLLTRIVFHFHIKLLEKLAKPRTLEDKIKCNNLGQFGSQFIIFYPKIHLQLSRGKLFKLSFEDLHKDFVWTQVYYSRFDKKCVAPTYSTL